MNELKLSNYSRRNNLRIRKFGEEYFMICSGKCYKVNETGAIVVKYIEKDITVHELSKKITDVYAGEKQETIERDIKVFIDFLLLENLIQTNEE